MKKELEKINDCYLSILSLCEKIGTKIVQENLSDNELGGFDNLHNEIIINPDRKISKDSLLEHKDNVELLLTLAHEYYHAKVFHEKTSLDHSEEFIKAVELLKASLPRLKHESEARQKEIAEELAVLIPKANEKYYEEELAADHFAFSHVLSFGLELPLGEKALFTARSRAEIVENYENVLFAMELKKIHKILSTAKSLKNFLIFTRHFPKVSS